MTMTSRLCLSLVVAVSAITLIAGGTAQPGAERDALVVFLVRHAEKVAGGPDPALSVDGSERVKELAMILRDSGIEHVHSSDYVRTKTTAAPVAEQLGLEVELYNPRQLQALVDEMHKLGGKHLVVGHSNTTPSLVTLLAGDPGSEIDEPGEYDRLYIVTVDGDGSAHTVLLRYGNMYHPQADEN